MGVDATAGEIGDEQSLVVKIAAGLISATAIFAITANVTFEVLTSRKLVVVFLGLLGLHVLTRPRLLFCREFGVYAVLFAYVVLSSFWAPDRELADYTIYPVAGFLLIMLLFGSLLTFHDVKAVLTGLLVGFIAGAAVYDYVWEFPLSLPDDLSYNSVASMYLFGVFVVLLFGWATRSKVMPVVVALVFLVHIVATTSIKTNLGVVLGAGVAGLVYFRQSMVVVRRNVLTLSLASLGGAYLVLSNDALVERMNAGFDRVSVGLAVLNTRENVAGYGGFNEREYWAAQGLQGWASNPFFGYGAEAFRATYGITSHSTPIDLLFNTGLIGFSLFYGMLMVFAWRLLRTVGASSRGLRALVLAVLACYLFMSLSATLFFHTFLAAFVGVGVALLRRAQINVERPERVSKFETRAANIL